MSLHLHLFKHLLHEPNNTFFQIFCFSLIHDGTAFLISHLSFKTEYYPNRVSVYNIHRHTLSCNHHICEMVYVATWGYNSTFFPFALLHRCISINFSLIMCAVGAY